MADEAGGAESGASGSGSGSGTEPASAPPATGTPIPIGDAVVSTICVLHIFFYRFRPTGSIKAIERYRHIFQTPQGNLPILNQAIWNQREHLTAV